MRIPGKISAVPAAVVALTFMMVACDSTQALARPHQDFYPRSSHHSRHYPRHHPYYGERVSLPELIAKAVIVGGLEYYYHHGVFYQRHNGIYVVTDPPPGAVVSVIPDGYKVVLINGKRYYYYNEVYYVKASRGYAVVDDPVYQVADFPQNVKVLGGSPEISGNTKDIGEYTVNIPNANGSYTAVKLVKSGNGYTGPQGEYYPEFPRVEQLKAMYGGQ